MMDWQRTIDVCPNGVQTESKRPDRYIKGVYPTYLVSGEGAYVTGPDGKRYCDWTASLGAILLGHAQPRVTESVCDRLSKGNLFVTPHWLETELAERLRSLIPCMEMMRFLKSGTEACMAAVKIARTYTGGRKTVVSVGYHGWSDIFTCTSAHPDGCPGSRKSEIVNVAYNDFDSLFELFMGYRPRPGREPRHLPACDISAVIMEPIILEEPRDDYLEKVRQICSRFGAVLIFDEVVTGFRWKDYTCANYFHVQPDLICLGKGLGNGLPISVIGGKRDLMNVLTQKTFVSSTFGADLVGIVAAMKVLDIIEQDHVADHIWDIGQQLKDRFNALVQGLAKTGCVGYPCRSCFDFPTEVHRSVFWQSMIEEGIFIGYANFPYLSHGRVECANTYASMQKAMANMQPFWDDPSPLLKGKVAEDTLRLR